MRIHILTLKKAVFFLERIQQSSLTIKNKKQSKTGILMKLTKNLVATASNLWIRY